MVAASDNLIDEQTLHIKVLKAEHEAAMTRAREDADRVGAARMTFEERQTRRIGALETLLSQTIEPLSNAGLDETDPYGLIMQIKLTLDGKANGPG